MFTERIVVSASYAIPLKYGDSLLIRDGNTIHRITINGAVPVQYDSRESNPLVKAAAGVVTSTVKRGGAIR